jgi:phage replication-related protein YjqB (UPF0714/DUF867 family)
MGKYSSFSELQQYESEGEDYAILYRKATSGIAVMAPHGGGIEPGTIDIADGIAESDYVFYAFKGLKKAGNRILHLSSNRFDEPLGMETSSNAAIVISVHGCRDTQEIIFIGGLNRDLKIKLAEALQTAGFNAVVSEVAGMRGISPENICNRCKSGEGVQLEISRGLREKMFDRLDRRLMRKKTEVFYRFVKTVRAVIAGLDIVA